MAQCGGGPASRRAQQQQETTSVVESHFQGLLGDVMAGDDDRYRALCGAFGYLQQPEWLDLSSACYAGFGAPPGAAVGAREISNGGNSFSCSGSASSGGGDSRKRKPDAHADAKVKIYVCMRVSSR
jgi:hypothetical protein